MVGWLVGNTNMKLIRYFEIAIAIIFAYAPAYIVGAFIANIRDGFKDGYAD